MLMIKNSQRTLFNVFDVAKILREYSLGFASLNTKATQFNCLRQYFQERFKLLPHVSCLIPSKSLAVSLASHKRTGRQHSQSLADSRIPCAVNDMSQAGAWRPRASCLLNRLPIPESRLPN